MNDTTPAFHVLLVEDNPGDILLTQEALEDSDFDKKLYIARDGEEALRFLRKEEDFGNVPTPDIILLDLNMPRMDGRELLEIIKKDDQLKVIPVIVLTTSDAEQDILESYSRHANCFITKPVDFTRFTQIVRVIEQYWFQVTKLPGRAS